MPLLGIPAFLTVFNGSFGFRFEISTLVGSLGDDFDDSCGEGLGADGLGGGVTVAVAACCLFCGTGGEETTGGVGDVRGDNFSCGGGD